MSAASWWIKFVLAVLATWRVTHLLASEDGPADIIVRFRAWLGESLAGKLMDCFYCLSLWIAAAAALYVTRQFWDWLMVWLAVSGAACLLERLGREHLMMEPVSQVFQEPMQQAGQRTFEGDIEHVLRSETSGDQEEFVLNEHTYDEHAGGGSHG